MIYPHHQKAIDYITDKMQSDNEVEALLISGSIMHGFNQEHADIDINIAVSNELYEQKSKAKALTYWESAESFYTGGYFDGKFITLDYLNLVAERGSEPSRFALFDSFIAFDKTGQAADYLQKIGTYRLENIQENTIKFLSQLEAWNWYCKEAIKHDNQYLLDLSVSKLILFTARLVLLLNKKFFPYHKWLIRVLEDCESKPDGLMPAIGRLLERKTADNITHLYELIKNYRDWPAGMQFSWGAHFLNDVETLWMRQDEFIENI
ncbi:MAG: DUF4037 domain-containing protein [Defluviitaleaceae bacterium]|nr:DUF4037 domain-containing protein [Defluviitaleaceae bacterium]MCL2837299.1 DUF4037 domain-containing protein [Defluviitaleaceae bacterium]